jgi:hypothetical protein
MVTVYGNVLNAWRPRMRAQCILNAPYGECCIQAGN